MGCGTVFDRIRLAPVIWSLANAQGANAVDNSNIIDFTARRDASNADAGFLRLVDRDIASNPSSVQPIPAALLKAAEALISKMHRNKEAELLEG